MSDFTAKMQQKTSGGRALPGPGGELKRSPTPPSREKGALLLREGRGREGRRERKGGKGGRGRGVERRRVGGGERGKGEAKGPPGKI